MTAKDFVPKDCFLAMRSDVEQRKTFQYEKKVKAESGEYTIRLDARYIDSILAQSIWNGKEYLLGFNLEYHGPKVGMGGTGFCFTDYDVFDDWERFKAWLDDRFSTYKKYGYELEELGQMSLF